MSGMENLERFLRTDPRDGGCEQAIELLHVYADLVAAGAPADARFPEVAAHLRACGPCAEDLEALLAAVAPRGSDDPAP
jgi:hypothetical protein